MKFLLCILLQNTFPKTGRNLEREIVKSASSKMTAQKSGLENPGFGVADCIHSLCRIFLSKQENRKTIHKKPETEVYDFCVYVVQCQKEGWEISESKIRFQIAYSGAGLNKFGLKMSLMEGVLFWKKTWLFLYTIPLIRIPLSCPTLL